MLARLVNGHKPHLPPLFSQKNEILIFVLPWTSDDQPGWLMDSNPICHPSPAKKNEILIFGFCSTSDDQPGWSMDSNPICHPSPAKKWNAYFWITFNFWWLARLVDGLKPNPPPLSWQKNEMLIFGLHSLLMIGWASWWTLTSSATPLLPKKWNAQFLIMFNWWSARLVNGLKTHLPPLSSQKNEMLIFGLHSTSDHRLSWLMDWNPIHHPSPAKKMKCSFLDYVQLLMISQAAQWTQTPSATPLQPKNEILIFGLYSNSDDWPGWLRHSNPIHHPSPAKKNEMLIFGLRSLLMICLADWWTWTSSATPLLPKKWNAQFLITFNFWWSAKLVNWLKVHLPPLSSQ